jgi:hypothetical protein
MRYRDLLIVWGMLVVLASPGCAATSKEHVQMRDVPAAVQETIRMEAPENAQVTIERRRMGDREVFEVEMNDGFREVEILIDDQGRLVRQEKD